MIVQLIIFDFDGVVADSETIACGVLAQIVTRLGRPMSLTESIDRFMGKRIGDVTAAVEEIVGQALPSFQDDVKRETFEAFKTELREVAGLSDFLARHISIPRCIASSSSQARIHLCLDILHLERYFAGRVFSAEDVPRGKPFPDIFLHAAKTLSVSDQDILVIEDSPGGVEAAVAAGMRVVGLLAATHLRPGHEHVLRAKGATYIAQSYEDVTALIAELQSGNIPQ